MDLSSLHITSLLMALLGVIVYYASYFGISKKNFFFESLISSSFILCFISILLPYLVVLTLVYILFIIGLFLSVMKFRELDLNKKYSSFKSYFVNAKKFEKYLIIFCALHILSGVIGTTVLSSQGTIIDAMTYHLGGPKEWALFLDGPKLSTINPEALTASYYEYLVYPLFLLLKPLYVYLTPLKSTSFEFLNYSVLVWGQLFSGVIGLLFVPKLIWDLFKNKMNYFYFLLILTLGMRGMNWVWKTAKNDAFPLFCTLVAYRFFNKYYKSKDDTKIIFFTFFFLGIGLGAKMTNLYPMILILIYIFIENFNKIKKSYNLKEILIQIGVAGAGGLVALMPFLLRNIIETSNPFFPTTSTVFENLYLTDAVDAFHKLYSYPTNWATAFMKLKSLYIDSPGFILITVISLYLKKWKQPLFFFISILFISKITGERFMWRQVSMIIFFVIIWGESLFDIFINTKNKMPKYTVHIITILVLVLSQFKPERLIRYPYKFYFEQTGTVMARNYYAWTEQLEENLKHRIDKNFISNYSSYLSRFRHLNVTDSREEFRKSFLEKRSRDR